MITCQNGYVVEKAKMNSKMAFSDNPKISGAVFLFMRVLPCNKASAGLQPIHFLLAKFIRLLSGSMRLAMALVISTSMRPIKDWNNPAAVASMKLRCSRPIV